MKSIGILGLLMVLCLLGASAWWLMSPDEHAPSIAEQSTDAQSDSSVSADHGKAGGQNTQERTKPAKTHTKPSANHSKSPALRNYRKIASMIKAFVIDEEDRAIEGARVRVIPFYSNLLETKTNESGASLESSTESSKRERDWPKELESGMAISNAQGSFKVTFAAKLQRGESPLQAREAILEVSKKGYHPTRIVFDVTKPALHGRSIRLLPSGVIRGVAIDQRRLPAAGARIVATRKEARDWKRKHYLDPIESYLAERRVAKADANGNFEFKDMALGNWELRATEEGTPPISKAFEQYFPCEYVHLTSLSITSLQLSRADELRFRLANQDCKEVTLSLQLKDQPGEILVGKIKADDYGTFRSKTLGNMQGEIIIRASGLNPFRHEFESRVGEDLDLGKIGLEELSNFSVRVEDQAGNPIEGASVGYRSMKAGAADPSWRQWVKAKSLASRHRLGEYTHVSDAEGQAHFPVEFDFEYQIAAFKAGFVAQSQRVQPSLDKLELVLVLEPSTSIKLTLKMDSANPCGIQGQVFLLKGNKTASTLSNAEQYSEFVLPLIRDGQTLTCGGLPQRGLQSVFVYADTVIIGPYISPVLGETSRAEIFIEHWPSIMGSVIGEDGNSLANHPVWLEHRDGKANESDLDEARPRFREVLSDANGRYHVPFAQTGSWVVCCEHDAKFFPSGLPLGAVNRRSVSIAYAKPGAKSTTLDINFAKQVGTTLFGKATLGGLPEFKQGFVVRINDRAKLEPEMTGSDQLVVRPSFGRWHKLRINEDGSFMKRELGPGDYCLKLETNKHEPSFFHEFRVNEGEKEVRFNHDFAAFSLSGVIRDWDAVTDASAVSIKLNSVGLVRDYVVGSIDGFISIGGSFSFEGLQSGGYTLSLSREGYISQNRVVRIEGGSVRGLTLAPLVKYGSLRTTLRSFLGNKELGEGVLALKGPNWKSVLKNLDNPSASKGSHHEVYREQGIFSDRRRKPDPHRGRLNKIGDSFDFADLEPGRYELTLRRKGFHTVTEVFEVVSGEETSLEFDLRAKGMIVLKVETDGNVGRRRIIDPASSGLSFVDPLGKKHDLLAPEMTSEFRTHIHYHIEVEHEGVHTFTINYDGGESQVVTVEGSPDQLVEKTVSKPE